MSSAAHYKEPNRGGHRLRFSAFPASEYDYVCLDCNLTDKSPDWTKPCAKPLRKPLHNKGNVNDLKFPLSFRDATGELVIPGQDPEPQTKTSQLIQEAINELDELRKTLADIRHIAGEARMSSPERLAAIRYRLRKLP